MKLSLFYFMISIAFAAISCAPAATMPQVGTDHPAHPIAAVPKISRSTTLAYALADTSPLQPMSNARGLGGASPNAMLVENADAQNTVDGVGTVVATVPSSGQLVLDHGEIKGFMDAMTMGYRIEPSSLLQGLKAGDQVRFTIDLQKKAIIKIEKMP